jgi:hypothetical protein
MYIPSNIPFECERPKKRKRILCKKMPSFDDLFCPHNGDRGELSRENMFCTDRRALAAAGDNED